MQTAWSEWRWWRGWWVFGIYSVGLWCPFKAVQFTGLGLGWSLDEAHAAPGWGWDSLDTCAFLWSTTMEHTVCTQPTWPCLINGFEGRLHPFLCFHHTSKCFILFIHTFLFGIIYYSLLSSSGVLVHCLLSSHHPIYVIQTNKYHMTKSCNETHAIKCIVGYSSIYQNETHLRLNFTSGMSLLMVWES